MLAEFADRLEEADKLTDCGMPFTSALLLQPWDDPPLSPHFFSWWSLPSSFQSAFFSLVCINKLHQILRLPFFTSHSKHFTFHLSFCFFSTEYSKLTPSVIWPEGKES